MKCYNTQDGVHIPGCMGCAVYGHDGCTCPSGKKADQSIEERVQMLESDVRELKKLLDPVNTKTG